MIKRKDNIHFIGIGGIGMSGLARILNLSGFKITGSDSRNSELLERLRSEGIKCFTGHNEKNLRGRDTVVYSSSIRGGNVELLAARKKGCKIAHRAEMLSEMFKRKISIAVTGAHGKTTTSAVLALIFQKAGFRPTAAVGGEIINFQSNALCQNGKYFIFEADESDGSFLKYYPDRAVLLNIDREHFDYFRTMSNALDAYRRFIENVKPRGTVYYNADDGNLNRLLKHYHGKKLGFGAGQDARVSAVKIRQFGVNMHFKCVIDGSIMPQEIVFPAPGRHNVTNALAAISAAIDAKIPFSKIASAIAGYQGTKRRFEIQDTSYGFMLIEDYAHHPTEIKAVLEACAPLGKNIIAVFQPHRYTRTKDLFKEFAACFKAANHVILTDIYAASEKSIKGVTAKRLYSDMKRGGIKNVEYTKKSAISRRIIDIAGKNDLVLILGAGDICEVTNELRR